jgi:hypothetical protein
MFFELQNKRNNLWEFNLIWVLNCSLTNLSIVRHPWDARAWDHSATHAVPSFLFLSILWSSTSDNHPWDKLDKSQNVGYKQNMEEYFFNHIKIYLLPVEPYCRTCQSFQKIKSNFGNQKSPKTLFFCILGQNSVPCEICPKSGV